MEFQHYIRQVTEGQALSQVEMVDAMQMIMTGLATPAQIGGFLIALRVRGETVEEITAAASVMRELATKVNVAPQYLVDTCGTGGDASGTFNVSTASAIVAAAAGAKVAKHGNRSVSSKSGSADVLEKAGVNINLNPEQVQQCIEEVGVGFLFAQRHHGAMRYAIGPRRELGVRTIFNLLGPLTNPANAPHQVLGVFAKQWVLPLAQVLQQLGSQHVMVVHGAEGLDEISIAGPTHIAELKNGQIREYTLHPEKVGLKAQSLQQIRVPTVEASLAMINTVLDGQVSTAYDMVTLNAGAALYTAGLADSHRAGIALANTAIQSGKAKQTLQHLIALTNQLQTSS